MANLPPALVLGLASPAAAWAGLVAASLARRQLNRLRAWRAERRRVRLVELPARDAAERAAAERRACLHDFLRGALDLDPEDDVRSPTGVVHEEFREPLPELRGLPGGPFQSDAGRRFEPDEPARYWHTSLLYWQLDADPHLLAGRVLDVLARLRRGGLLTAADAPTHVRLAPLPDRPATRDRFPWRVVLGGPVLSSKLRDVFVVLRDWLGIGVEFERARPFRLCGAERPGGVVGGVVAVPGGEQYGVTCRHTLAAGGPEPVFPSPDNLEPGDFTTAGPDAALVEAAGAADVRGVIAATRTAVQAYRRNQTPLTLARRGGRRTGVLAADGEDVCFTAADGATYAGPHLRVEPRPRRLLGFDWPPWGRPFAARGDSGAWVLAGNAEWVGVVVAGEANGRVAAVIPAYFLLDVFRRALGAERLGAARREV